MSTFQTKRTFVTSAVIAMAAVLGGAASLGLMANNASASATDALPSTLNAQELGEGGLVTSSIRLVTETKNFSVWTARDRANNICKIAYATPEGNASAVCVDEEQFRKKGLSSSMQVGIADEGDLGVTMLQTYLLPDGINAKAAAELIPGSTAVDQLVARYGPIELERSTRISVPSDNRKLEKFELTVFGRESI